MTEFKTTTTTCATCSRPDVEIVYIESCDPWCPAPICIRCLMGARVALNDYSAKQLAEWLKRPKEEP